MNLTWELEKQQRKQNWRGGGARFPDYGNLFGDKTNHTGWQNNGTAREAQSQFSPFTVPYAGLKTVQPSAVPKRVGIDVLPVLPGPGLFPAVKTKKGKL